MELDRAQRQAVVHYNRPALVLAGPGSGKTTVLIKRVKYLIENHHVPPASILVITYTRAAARSMEKRFIGEMKGKVLPVAFGTFHAIFYHILQEHYHLRQDCLLNQNEKYSLMIPLLKKMNLEEELAEELLAGISLLKNGISQERFSLPAGIDAEAFHMIRTGYDRQKKRLGKMDFDDMLADCLRLFHTQPQVLMRWQEQFAYILVDEFQDCNKIQYEILKMLAAPRNNLFVVGDDDQAIYGFRGASPGILQQFVKDYPSASKYVLEANYRSRKEIVCAAGKVIRENQERFSKQMYAAGIAGEEGTGPGVAVRGFPGREEQFSYLTARLSELAKRFPLEEMAVLCRTNGELEFLLPYLQKAQIPYVVKGQIRSRYRHFAVQDVAAYLKLAMGKRERKLVLQVGNKPVRGIGRDFLWEETIDFSKLAESYRDCGRTETAEAVTHLQENLEKAGTLSPYLAIQLVRKVAGYEKWLREKAGKDKELYAEWKELLDELQKEAKSFGTISQWLAFLEKEERLVDEAAANRNKAGVQLMTLHASKGLEFAYVCLPNVNERGIPHGKIADKDTEEEERRLFFVGMTRAKTALDILYLTGTREYPKLPSRFLYPLLEDYSSSPSTSSSNS